MATSSEEIYNQLAQKVAEQPGLAGLSPSPDSAAQLATALSSNSRVSIWRLLMRAVSYVHKTQQDNFDRFRLEVVGLARDNMYGTRRWFIARAKAFQMGYSLVFTTNDASYSVDDPGARIVTHAAVVELANVVVVKVAKAAGSGLAKLSAPELVAINDYFQELRPPVQVAVLTADPDRIRLTGSVVFDGQTPLGGVQSGVQFELTQYLKSLDFGGVVRITDLRAAMLRASGVVDVRLDLVEVRTTGPWTTIPRVHYTYAGHAVIDAASPITSTLEWAVGNV